jgi:UDP-glucose:(glucosyl)LPS alpha-1,2-glucosyltransferase
MKFTVTGMEDPLNGTVDENGDVVAARGGTEMMKEGLLERLDPDLAEQFNIICSRVRDISDEKKNVLWLHDTWDDPEAQHLREAESRSRFAKLVFVSNYQFQTYHMGHGVQYRESVVLKNAITPIDVGEKDKEADVIRLIYHTTPHRGLEILVPVFDHLWNSGYEDKIHLDVFSSFNIYGWPQRDEPYQELFQRCKDHPGITYHGSVDNNIVREYLKQAHIFAYPNIWPETSCISVIEAMSAGCAIICPNYAALSETTGNFANMYQWHEDTNTHANIFASILNVLLEKYHDPFHKDKLGMQKIWTDAFYSWDNRIPEWDGLLRGLQNG